MAADEPPYLTVGTDVSAKYKGAFCEAKIKKVMRMVKCKVTFKNNLGAFMVTDDQIKGPLRIGADIDAKHPEKNQFCEGVINKLQDYSQYTVVFDDGDETTLRRTSLCLKSGRHFAESPTLDQFPLTNPEHFGTPVIGTGKFKRKRRSTVNSSLDYDGFSSDEEEAKGSVRKIKSTRATKDRDVGKVVSVDYGDRRKKDNWYPALTVLHHSAQPIMKVTKDEVLVRSFRDGKYYAALKKDVRDFSKECIQKIENSALKSAAEKAVLYLEKVELPPHWDKISCFPLSEQPASATDDTQDSDSDSSDDEPSEEKDRFVAQLYKFMDERGTPINKAPTVSNRDLNLYKLFKIMHKLGGYNKVTNKNKWKIVYSKMGLPHSNVNGPNQIKFAYKRYLQSFEDFYRKLGCTMVSNSRTTRGRHRSDRNFIVTRTREKDCASPKSRIAKDVKEKIPTEKKAEAKLKINDKKDDDEKSKTPEKKRIEKPPRSEEKDEKKKREEKIRLVRSQSLNKDKKDIKDESKPEKARTREDARKEKNESPEKKGTRSNSKIDVEKKDDILKEKDKVSKDKEEKVIVSKDNKDEKTKIKKEEKTPTERKGRGDRKVDEKLGRQKDGSREERTPRAKKKEDLKEDKISPKKKIERLLKEKKEDKPSRIKAEEKVTAEVNKKPEDEEKVQKEEKQEVEVKKDCDSGIKEKLRPKRRDESPISEGEATEGDTSQDSFDKKDSEEPPNKGRRKYMKDDKEDKESFFDLSDSDESSTNDSEKYKDVKHSEIVVGDRVKVKYGRGRMQKVYEAKVLKIEPDGTDRRYFVHYAGWNTRYDEWVRKNYIVAIINGGKQKQDNLPKSPLLGSGKKNEKICPPGIFRKNSTSSTNSSCSRATRRGRLSPPLPTRNRPGTMMTDLSQGSDTDDPMNDLDDELDVDDIPTAPDFKEELFSDDEEKEKQQDVKREDITELEKTISLEEYKSNLSSSFFENLNSSNLVKEKKEELIEESIKKENFTHKDFMESPKIFEDDKTEKLHNLLDIKKESDTSDIGCMKAPPTEEKTYHKNFEVLPTLLSEDVKKPVPTIKYSNIIFPSTSSPQDVKKQLNMQSSLSLPTGSAVSSCESKLTSKITVQPPVHNEASALNFTGLIKKSSTDLCTSEKTVSMNKETLKCSPLPTVAKNEQPSKNVVDIFNHKAVFGPILSSKKTDSINPSERLVPKAFSNIFSFSLKTENVTDLGKKSGSSERKVDISVKTASDGKLAIQGNKISASSETKKFFKESQSKPVLSPSKFGGIKTEVAEIKPKDSFDILLQDKKATFTSETKKMSDVKTSIFSLSFGSAAPKDKNSAQIKISQTVDTKKSKSSDVDLSKMIPGILERLKCDVVADLKVSSNSPPSHTETLNFDFLQSSQNISKTFSRSDSSSSLRICESDSNDSNIESKNTNLDIKLCTVLTSNSSELSVKKTTEKEEISLNPPEIKPPTLDSTPEITNDKPYKISAIQQTLPVFLPTSSTLIKHVKIETGPILDSVKDRKVSFSEDNKSISKFEPDSETKQNISKQPLLPSSTYAIVKKTNSSEISDNQQIIKSTLITKTYQNEENASASASSSQNKIDFVEEKSNMKEKVEDVSAVSLEAVSKIKNLSDMKKDVDEFTSAISKIILSIDEGNDSHKLVEKPYQVIKTQNVKEENKICEEIKADIKSIVDSPSLSTDISLPYFEVTSESKTSSDPGSLPENYAATLTCKKEGKKKKLGKKLCRKFGVSEADKDNLHSNSKDLKNKSKKRIKFGSSDKEKLKRLSRAKKLKKNKNKKAFPKLDGLFDDSIKSESKDTDLSSEKCKRKDKKKSDRKFLKTGIKNDDSVDSKNEIIKKKKSKKKEKLFGDRKEYFEKKTKKKRKLYLTENPDSESEKEISVKIIEKKRKKDRKKIKLKDSTSSDEEDFFKNQSKEMKPSSRILSRQDSTKSEDPDMSFLLCEENVPASPVDVNNLNDTSVSESDEQTSEIGTHSLPHVYSRDGSSHSIHNCGIDTVLDNTPPTTPSSTESLLSSSPTHDRDLNYPESTQSGQEGEPDIFHLNSNRTVARDSEEYSAATTLAFAVCKSVSEKPKDGVSFSKCPPHEHIPSSSKRKKKKKRLPRYSDLASSKSPKHKPSFPLMPKVDSFCEDSSGQSGPASSSPPYGGISTLSFTRALPHRLSGLSEGLSRHHYINITEKDPEKRISLLQEKMTELRKHYLSLRAEVIAIDHKRRKARKKAKDSSGCTNNNSQTFSEDGPNCS